VETEKRKAVPFRCPTCGSEAVFCDSDAEGSLPWVFCEVCRKYGGRPKNFWCPECGSQDFLDYTELGKYDNGLLYCSACRKTGLQGEFGFARRPRPWHWRCWRIRIDSRSLVLATGAIILLHLSVSHHTAVDLFGHTGPSIIMGIIFYFALSETFRGRR
jgi:transcription elongation factor Elf1